MALCLLGLGSNLGDREAVLRTALDQLDQTAGVRVTRVSSFHGTHPAGGPEDQPEFLNACAIVETSLAPQELLAATKKIEHNLGRVRSEHWGPRTLDLDLLLFDAVELRSAELEIPHPRMVVRQFALVPAAEIAAEWVYPVNGWTVAELLANLQATPRGVAVYSENPGPGEQLAARLREQLGSAWNLFSDIRPSELPRQRVRFAVILASEPGDNASVPAALEELAKLCRSPAMCPALWIYGEMDTAVVEVVAACQASE